MSGRPFIPMFRVDFHADMTIQACPDDPRIKDNLPIIVAANVATDLNQFESALHFDNCCFDLGVQRINDLWTFIESGSDENPFVSFGTMIHTVEDFYAHSNWVELHVDQSPIPVWDLVVATLPAEIVSGTFWLDSPKECGPGAPTHEQLNKDSPTSEEGSKVVPSGPNEGKTLFDLAYAAALA
ncbi:MAG TPA: hypothetical protein VHA57_08210, partial [Actinomycetota bacterium]|nr:hypothetical protein [Actinomycetota bacterium]